MTYIEFETMAIQAAGKGLANPDVEKIIQFWSSIGPKGWFTKDADVDAQITSQFTDLHEKAARGELDDWVKEPKACLAYIILLDQLSRNMFRGDRRAFAQDAKAVQAALYAAEHDHERQVDSQLATFLFMPFMHSESIVHQDLCAKLLHRMGAFMTLDHLIWHRDLIRRFGRFPHRNAVLGRHTSAAEQLYLDSGGFKG